MGKLQGGILGTMTGKVGGVVGSTWKDKNTLRSYRSSIAVSQTAAAVNGRTTFAKAVTLTGLIAAKLARPYWQRFQKSMSGYNALLSSVRASFTNAGVFVPGNLVISRGKLEEQPIIEVSVSGAVGNISWFSQLKGYQLSSDLPVLVLVKADGSNAIAFDSDDLNVTRFDDSAVFDPTTIGFTTGDYAYLAFRRADGSVVSNSASSVCI